MFTTMAELIAEWTDEAANTQRVLDTLTDASLQQQVTPDGRTLGRIAWHMATSIPEFLSHFGVALETPKDRFQPQPGRSLMAFEKSAPTHWLQCSSSGRMSL